ncbi:MAG: MaoC family dehydratase [Thermodesulfobacteriota bacterium]|nr:MaoC family dehydratase [Thermodesulfobacteriota bacterium]
MEYELGKHYEEIEMGQKASFSKTVSETDIYLFAGISGDFNAAHLNEAYAKTTRFKTRIAHGFVPMCLCAPVIGMKLPGLGTVVVDFYTQFIRPTYIGDTITATAEVVEKIESKRRVKLSLTWVNQDGEPVCEGWVRVIPPKVKK